MIVMQFKLTLPCSALHYSALAFQNEQPCLEMKLFFRNAQTPFLQMKIRLVPDMLPGSQGQHALSLLASCSSNCFLSQKKKKYHLELI